jgi:hypothetical protein
MIDAEKIAAIQKILAGYVPLAWTVENGSPLMDAEHSAARAQVVASATTLPVQFPTRPTGPAPAGYYNGTPTRVAAEAIDRARWGLDVSGTQHQTNETVTHLWDVLEAWTDPLLLNSASQFSDPNLFFVEYLNGAINCEDAFANGQSMTTMPVKSTVQEWLDAMLPPGGGIYKPPQTFQS